MKNTFLIGLIFLSISCKGQDEKQNRFTIENFDEQILIYQPVKNELNKNSYADGLRFLEETKKRIIKNNKIDISDYWNILTVFNNLKESNENIDIAFEKFLNTEDSCEYLVSFEEFFDKYTLYIESKMTKELKICNNSVQIKNTKKINVKEYSITNGLDENLVKLIERIGILDQKDRYNEKIQNKLDIKNQKKIDSLYSKYQIYIGKTLVGNELKSVMWQVIQHSNLTYMEKYLPIVNTAVKENELGESALKYLIDRIYSGKYNYQIFGSQGSIKMADELIRNQVKSKYKIK
ncbi:hypothetical protein [Gillisia limnaea]|uniref:Lipoprotein n=1 Tax=Gillisia limnaea (strain DSM 15749 / LMG 21470 / R-8282) TaxID=865937 RepID=H2BQK7_GILLR|nr:hypothetical protein [Gillisia limnaea]EHQ04176.1 hypothetical protein Gilli_0014 [Gillisia limnaea DSM 15749]